MVLDDVTSSFDAGHQFALMDALRTLLQYGAAPDGLQFIILSHDTSLEKYFDKLNGTTDWHHQKLQGMPPKGRLMVSAQGADRLKAQAQQHLHAGQVDIGAPFLRQYLPRRQADAFDLYRCDHRCRDAVSSGGPLRDVSAADQ